MNHHLANSRRDSPLTIHDTLSRTSLLAFAVFHQTFDSLHFSSPLSPSLFLSLSFSHAHTHTLSFLHPHTLFLFPKCTHTHVHFPNLSRPLSPFLKELFPFGFSDFFHLSSRTNNHLTKCKLKKCHRSSSRTRFEQFFSLFRNFCRTPSNESDAEKKICIMIKVRVIFHSAFVSKDEIINPPRETNCIAENLFP